MLAIQTPPELETIAAHHNLTPAFALGLGAGLYFEYFRRPHPSPTHYVSGLARDFELVLATRLARFAADPLNETRAALRENALRFNLDRSPITALMGLEMLAEELPQFSTIPDSAACLEAMGQRINDTGNLYRSHYVLFLDEVHNSNLPINSYSNELREIANEWSLAARHLLETAHDPLGLEDASRLMRRLAFREEHFWGTILEGTA